ncbi:hypothetical protein DMENIID0001_059670 [Sergentomyia squamirostris]
MRELGIPSKLISLARMTISNSMCQVKVVGERSDVFRVSSGLRQGDALSPILFNLALEYAMRRTGYNEKSCIYYKAEKMGLKVNDSKTKYMVTGNAASKFRQTSNTSAPVLTTENEVRIEVNERPAAGSRCYFALSSIFRSRCEENQAVDL